VCFTTSFQILSVSLWLIQLSKKLKLSHYTTRWRLGGRRYSSYSFLTWVLDAVSGQRHAPAALYPRGKDPQYPLHRMLGGPHSRSGSRVRRKLLCLCRGSNLDRPLVQSIARHYTRGSQTMGLAAPRELFVLWRGGGQLFV
jgi:hypothetical protein